tara:strand:+ start:279 stop:1112 length:834 start_codon:yes stop_codon:yes gene_type:complete
MINLYIVATPIGNLKDISERAVDIINKADFIVCENPKHSLKLLNNLGIKKKLISLHDYNEQLVIDRIKDDLRNKLIVLISDAGSPLISDPGFKLIQYCIKENIEITTIPGPSAIIPALQLSGLPINEFYFAGFLAKTKKHISDLILNLSELQKTSVFFVSSHKIIITLEIIDKIVPKRRLSISKEITKKNERVFRGTAKKIIDDMSEKSENIKGEFVVVMEGNLAKKTDLEMVNVHDIEIKKLLSKFSLTEVVQIVHKLTRIKKNKVYKWVLSLTKS